MSNAHLEYGRWFSGHINSRGLRFSQPNDWFVVRISPKACSLSNRTEALYCRVWFPSGWYAEHKLNMCIFPSWWKFHLQFRLNVLVEEGKVIVAPVPNACQTGNSRCKTKKFDFRTISPQALLILGRLTYPLPTFELHATAPRPNMFWTIPDAPCVRLAFPYQFPK